MKYCTKCLMTDTRPGLIFDNTGVCAACINYEKQKTTDWNKRLQELKDLCDHHRGCNGNGPDDNEMINVQFDDYDWTKWKNT